MYLGGIRYTFSPCVKVSNNYCRMSDLTLGDVFCSAPKHMIRLSVDYRQDSKIQFRLWKSLVEDTPTSHILPACTLWRFSTAWYGTVRFGTVHFWGVIHWVLYLVPGTFLVPPRPGFQAIRTVTKTWRVNSADHWLAGENRHYCVTELATHRPARFKSAQPVKERTQLLFEQTHLFVSTKKCMFRCLLRMFLSLIAEERIQWELDGATPKEKVLCIYFWTCYIYRVCLLFIFLPLYVCFASIKNNLIE